VVEQVSNIPTKGLVDPLTAEEIGNHFFGKFGATFLSVPPRLEALAKRGESVLGRVARDIEPILNKAVKAANKEEKTAVEAIFWELRDGDRLSKQRHALTPSEFRSEYHLITGKAPSEAATTLYNTVQELNDALYYLKADSLFKTAVDEGSEVLMLRTVNAKGVVTESDIVVTKAKDDLAPETVVYNVTTGGQLQLADIERNSRVFHVSGGLKISSEEVAEYIVSDAPNLRRLYHTDVMGYNPGGPRGYDFINFGVGQEGTTRLLGKGEVASRERLFMGTATRKEARLAVAQLNAILGKIAEMVPGLKGMTRANANDALRALGNDPELLEVVLRNKDWNTSVGDVTDFIKVVDKHRLDIRKDFGFKGMDDAFGFSDETGQLVFGARVGETVRDAFEGVLNSPRNGPRGNDPLIGMGGTSAPTVSPMSMIQRDFIRTTHERAFSAYNFQAVEGWLKGATPHMTPDSQAAIKGLPPRMAMDAAVFPKKPDEAARAYDTARDAINRTLGHVSRYETVWNNMVDRLAESVYDKGSKFSVGKDGKPSKGRALSIVTMQQSKNPLTALRGFAFDMKLGLFAMDQLFVQSSQIFNILAIADVRAVPAMAAYWPLRMTMINTSREFALELGRRSAAFTNMSAEEFADFSRFWNESGRGIIGSEAAEHGVGAVSHTMAKGLFSRVRGAARVFFNEGESIPRGAAMHVAWKEYRKNFPTLDPFADHGINTITARQDALTAAMTRVSAAPWQKGPLSVPLQFMSYTSRMMESLFSNRLLTGNERFRLAGAQLAFWGGSGTVFGGPFLDWLTTEGGVEMDGDTYTAFRYGILDWAIGATTGVDTGFGERLAVGEGIWNMWEDFSNEGVFEALGGPAGSVGKDVVLTLMPILGDIARGHTSMVEADLLKFVRNMTGANKAYNAFMLYTTGEYLSRNNTVLARGLTKGDALFHIIGAPLQEISRSYTMAEAFRDQDQHVKKAGKRIGEIMREMRDAVREGKDERAAELGRMAAITVTVLPRHQQQRARKFYIPDGEGLLIDMVREGRKRNMPNTGIFNDEGE
jgi:hypothetical protein